MNTVRLSMWGLLAVLTWPVLASAQPACSPGTPSYEALRDMEMVHCFDSPDHNPLLARIRTQVPSDFQFDRADADAVRAHQIGAALDAVGEYLRRARRGLDEAALARPVRALEQTVAAAADAGPGTKVDWQFEGESGAVGATGVNIKRYLNGACAAGGTGCRAAFDTAVSVLRAAAAMGELAVRADRISWSVFQERYSVIHQRWRSYLFEARSQYPWELAWNAWRYDAHRDKREGFPSPPDYQWIVLHPDVALEYVRDAPAGSRLEPAVVLELIGYNRWRWEGSRMRRPLGVSLVSTYSDRAGEQALGYGLLFHYNNTYSLGITSRDGDVGVFMSVDLGKYLLDKKSQLDDARGRFDLKQAVLGSRQ